MSVFVSTSIPYVNAAPHLGHALEFVQADVLARHHRQRGHRARLQTGTDDNASKNVAAARTAGRTTAEFVAANAARFDRLVAALGIAADDTVHTGADPRHRAGVERLWRICARRGDFYRHRYSGLYCRGCEQFCDPAELVDAGCPEHPGAVEPTTETNWFFRLSRYAEPIRSALRSGAVRIEPIERRNEVLAFVESGLTDISVSRPASRTDGWGIGVPGDPSQVVYVWWDALANYITTLGPPDSPAYRTWWAGAEHRIHVIGKGVLRFHAVFWLGLLLSTGQPLPSAIFVHEYLSVAGAKIAKSTGGGPDPEGLLDAYGVDALRWWLVGDVARLGDTDFTVQRLIRRYEQDLVGGVGNLVHRTCTLAYRHRVGPTVGPAESRTSRLVEDLPGRVAQALARFDLRGACAELTRAVGEVNRYLEQHRPWELGRCSEAEVRERLGSVVGTALTSCRVIATELACFVPDGAARLTAELDAVAVRPPRPVFERLADPPGRRAG